MVFSRALKVINIPAFLVCVYGIIRRYVLSQKMKRKEVFAPDSLCQLSSTQGDYLEVSHGQRGASLVEYGLVVALITVVAIAAVRVLGQSVSQQFSTLQAQIGRSSCTCPTQVAFVTAVYQQILRREPDPGGLSFWVSMISGGSTTRENFVQLACSSPEYQALVASTGTQSQGCAGSSISCDCN